MISLHIVKTYNFDTPWKGSEYTPCEWVYWLLLCLTVWQWTWSYTSVTVLQRSHNVRRTSGASAVYSWSPV